MRCRKDYFSSLIILWFSFGLVLACAAGSIANVKLPAVISDNMVLQQGEKIPIWGWAKAGEEVTVCFGDQKKSGKADAAGKWQIWLNPVKAEANLPGRTITITGENTIEIKNVLVGEVWFCSGQSNMFMTVGQTEFCKYGGVINCEQEIESARYPDIRLFTVEQRVASEPQADCNGVWVQCSPDTVRGFSAVAYFFGRRLHKELNVPIGLIHSSWGGTAAEAWMSKKALKSDAAFESIFTSYAEDLAKYDEAKKEYDQKMKEWEAAAEEAKAEGKEPAEKPGVPRGVGHKNTPSGLYNGMVSPIIPYGIRGVIWYQGEQNRKRAQQYRKLFPALIANWRTDWGEGDFPFYYVQIASYKYKEKTAVAAELREAQLKSMSIKNVGMAVTIDIGDPNIHPRNKQDVGRRLALWALAKTYSKKVEYCGPIYKSMKTKGDKIVLYFDYVDGGLISKDGEGLKGFTIAGADRKFFDADAKIDGDSVVIWSQDVAKPVAVRYGWANYPECNLYNKAGLPASPFRTDDWLEVTVDKK